MTDETSTELAPIPKESALAVLTNKEQFDAFYERVAKEVRGIEPDLTTSAGRKAIAALAFKVVKSKTAILAAADVLTEDARAQIKKVNESKSDIAERLDALRDETRKPLTDWEKAEELRETRAKEGLDGLRVAGLVRAEETADQLQARINALTALDISEDVFRDAIGIANNLRDHALTSLEEGKARAIQAEADAKELAELREARAERERQDEIKRQNEERERQEREAEETRQREEREEQERRENEERERVEREEQAERDRIANEERIADEARAETQRIADEAAERQRQETQRQHDEELEAERRKTEESERERQRLADEAAERDRQAKADADAAAARAKDRTHKSAVMAAARDAMLTVITEGKGIEPDDETKHLLFASLTTIVRAIVAGEIPNVTLTF